MAGFPRSGKSRVVRGSQTSSSRDGHPTSQAEASLNRAQSGTETRISEDHHTVSKFIQAMKNPNWRRRDSRDYKSDPLFPLSLQPHFPSGATNHVLNMQSADHVRYQSSNDADSEGWELLHADHDSSENQDISSRGTKPLDDNGVEMMSGSAGLCRVTLNDSIQTPGSTAPLNLIQLFPLRNVQESPLEGSQHDYPLVTAEIQRLNRTPDQIAHHCSDDLETQLMEALQAVTKTPPRIKSKHQSSKSYIYPPVPKKLQVDNNEAILRDLAIADIDRLQNIAGNQQPKPSVGPGTQNVSIAQSEEQQPADGRDAKLAFEKMLQKLHRRPDRSNGRGTESSKLRGESSQLTGRQPTTSATMMKGAWRDQRRTDTVDSGYASGPSTTSTGSANATSISSSSFNPRAREFFSFSGKEPAIPEEYQHQKFRRLPITDLFKQPAQDQVTGAATGDNVHEPPLHGLNVMPQPDSSVPDDRMESWKALMSNFLYAAGTSPDAYTTPGLPLNPFATWAAGQIPPLMTPVGIPALGMPAPSFAPGFLAGAPMYVPGNPPPGHPEGTTMPIPPPLPQMSGSTLPSVAGSGAPIQPRYVPKPRNPDPSDQLAYEAWIEWRKAHEPGYAMECKMRQRRRAQRITATKPKCNSDEKLDAISSEATPCIT